MLGSPASVLELDSRTAWSGAGREGADHGTPAARRAGATLPGLTAWLAQRGEPAYRSDQVARWIFQKRARSFAVMTDLPAGLRLALESSWAVYQTRVIRRQTATDGTDKLLLECRDGRRIETVLMREEDRRTVCVSSQVGCGMGCVFCASGLKGVERNLTVGEITEELLHARDLLPEHERLTNIVVMGMGESLANLENLIAALDRVCSPSGLGLSQRAVTISTVGLPEKIKRLAALDRRYHLAVSLHAPTEELRDQLVPINHKVGLRAVMEAADHYFAVTGRQVTFEYVLLGGINDRDRDARDLVALLAGRKAHVNLIPYNPVAGLPYERPAPRDLDRFVRRCRQGGLSVSVRKTKGKRIDAACGQLRRRVAEATVSTSAGNAGAAIELATPGGSIARLGG